MQPVIRYKIPSDHFHIQLEKLQQERKKIYNCMRIIYKVFTLLLKMYNFRALEEVQHEILQEDAGMRKNSYKAIVVLTDGV